PHSPPPVAEPLRSRGASTAPPPPLPQAGCIPTLPSAPLPPSTPPGHVDLLAQARRAALAERAIQLRQPHPHTGAPLPPAQAPQPPRQATTLGREPGGRKSNRAPNASAPTHTAPPRPPAAPSRRAEDVL